MTRQEDLERIRAGLAAAEAAIRPFTAGRVAFRTKPGRLDPVTAADQAADEVLRELLPARDEGWLSEETADDLSRLRCRRVWVVDPIDGTREFIEGIPEWCISIGLVEDGQPVAGGVLNPATGESMIGSVESGLTRNGRPARVRDPGPGAPLTVLASRSEAARGEWDGEGAGSVRVRACGSVAYKLALVAAGRADATWTRVPKSEWDVAAGAALVRAAGGRIALVDGSAPRFNQPRPRFPGFFAAGPRTAAWLLDQRLGVAP